MINIDKKIDKKPNYNFINFYDNSGTDLIHLIILIFIFSDNFSIFHNSVVSYLESKKKHMISSNSLFIIKISNKTI